MAKRVTHLAMAPVFVFSIASCSMLDTGNETVTAAQEPAGPEDESPDESTPTDSSDGGDDREEPSSEVEATSTTDSTAPPQIEMPDLTGQTESNARSVLNGLGVSEPTIETRESFEPAGTVLDQVPSAGTVVSGTVSLVIAESISPMPDFVGSQVAEARTWAQERAIELRIEEQLTDEIPSGEVVGQIPSPGAEVGQEIVVTVADAPVIVELAEFGSLKDYYGERGEIQMDGTVFPDTIYLEITWRTAWISYNLSRDWTTLKADLGTSDEHAPDAVVQIEIKGDDELLYSETIAFGTLQSVEVDVTGVLRLSISATKVDGDDTRVGLGNARLIGGAATSG